VHSNAVIIVLSVALLIAVGALVFGVGRFIYGITHYYLRERKPIRKIQHPQLGLLTSSENDDTLWAGQVNTDGKDMHFFIGGSISAPDEQLVVQLQNIMARFSDFERQAIEFLRSQEP
jgi:hypothetical protein